MTNTQKAVGLVIAGAVIGLLLSLIAGSRGSDITAGGVYNQVTNYFKEGLVVGGASQFSISSAGAITTSGNIIQTSGATVVNNLVQGSAGYAQTLSTAVGTSFAITPAQWCTSTSLLVPVSNTTTITITLPAASTTYATCGASVGSWSTQIVENESSFQVTYATSTGGNGITFFTATSSSANLGYPPKVMASTTQMATGLYTSSSALNLYRADQFRPTGY